jgi:hypothetical protein
VHISGGSRSAGEVTQAPNPQIQSAHIRNVGRGRQLNPSRSNSASEQRSLERACEPPGAPARPYDNQSFYGGTLFCCHQSAQPSAKAMLVSMVIRSSPSRTPHTPFSDGIAAHAEGDCIFQ